MLVTSFSHQFVCRATASSCLLIAFSDIDLYSVTPLVISSTLS